MKNTNPETTETEIKDVRKIKAKQKDKKGKAIADTKPKVDVTIKSTFPEIFKDTKYSAGDTVSFSVADKNSYLRVLQSKMISRSLRNKYPVECKEYIFSKYDGSLQEYIAHKNEIEVNDVFENAKTLEALKTIPSYLKTAHGGV